MPANLENSAVATGLEKVSFHSNPKERQGQRMFKLLHDCTYFTCKVMLKILQARLQQYVNQELLDVQAEFRKGIEIQRSNCQHLLDHQKKHENSRKASTSTLLIMPKPLTVWITTNYEKFLKRWEYQTTSPASWEIYMHVEKQQLEPDMEQWTGSKLGKEYIKAIYCLLMQSTSSWEMPDWMKHKLDPVTWWGLSVTSDMQMIPPLWQKVKKN